MVATLDACAHGGGDCNDGNASSFPHAPAEACDGRDNDCDGHVDEGCDDDGDGFCDSSLVVLDNVACPNTGMAAGCDAEP